MPEGTEKEELNSGVNADLREDQRTGMCAAVNVGGLDGGDRMVTTGSQVFSTATVKYYNIMK